MMDHQAACSCDSVVNVECGLFHIKLRDTHIAVHSSSSSQLGHLVARWSLTPSTLNLASTHRLCAILYMTAEGYRVVDADVTARLNGAIVHGRKRFDGRIDRCHVSSKSNKHYIEG